MRFFFSYASLDTQDVYLDKFFTDLSTLVALKLGVSAAEVAFRYERDNRGGADWLLNLSRELSTCDAFVAVYSPAYFRSVMCGREFQVFGERQRGYSSRLGPGLPPPELIHPVIWIRPRPGQPVPPTLTHTHKDYGQLYAEQGVEYLLRTHNEVEYQRFLVPFADQLIAAADRHQLPHLSQPPDMLTVDSAFGETGQKPGPTPSAGPLAVWFVLVVSTRARLDGLRRSVIQYGEKAEHWQPYAPLQTAPLMWIAQGVAHKENLIAHVCVAGADLSDRVDKAATDNELVVLLVDTWTLHLLPEFRQFVQPYDERTLVNSAVLVPWNLADDETRAHEPLLRHALQNAFANNCVRREKVFRDGIPSAADLEAELGMVLRETQRRVVERSGYRRPVIGPGPGQMPDFGL